MFVILNADRRVNAPLQRGAGHIGGRALVPIRRLHANVIRGPDVPAAMSDDRTLFQKIADGDVPADVVYEDDDCFAIRDINPQAPTHILVVPRKPIPSLDDLTESDEALVGHLFTVARNIAADEHLSDGYRTVFNCGPAAGQSVDHIHLHVLGGRALSWPPG